MFNPSRDEVRRFFCDAWRKRRDGGVVSPLDALALKWVDAHPEYHALLDDPERAVDADFSIDRGQSNPFLHLSMHLAVEEQVSIDQPPGIRAAVHRIAARTGDEHTAQHEAMECLGRVLWESQRGLLPADPQAISDAYVDCLRRRASRGASQARKPRVLPARAPGWAARARRRPIPRRRAAAASA
jgi:Domain of unknown function (DUF1841)